MAAKGTESFSKNHRENGRKGKILIYLLISAFWLTLLPAPGGRPTGSLLLALEGEMSPEDKAAIAKKTEELKDLNDSIHEFSQKQKENNQQQKSVIGQLKNLQDRMDQVEGQLAVLDKKLKGTQNNMVALEKDIEVKTGQVNQRNDYLDQRLRQLYIEGDVSYLEVLFESTSLTDFLTRYDLMGKVVENDLALLSGLKADRQVLQDQKTQLEALKAELEAIKQDQQAKHQTLEAQSHEKADYLEVLESDEAEIDKGLDELEAAQKQIEKFVAGIQNKYKSAYMGSGIMGWPLPGRSRISSAYGYRNHPITHKRSFHTGVDIPAPRNTPTLAAEKGKVIFAGNNGAYGNTVILDHGGGMSTQYSHLNTIGVGVGQIVLKGDVLGGVGTTGWSTGDHLHFTIMKDGKTVSPLDYVKKP